MTDKIKTYLESKIFEALVKGDDTTALETAYLQLINN